MLFFAVLAEKTAEKEGARHGFELLHFAIVPILTQPATVRDPLTIMLVRLRALRQHPASKKHAIDCRLSWQRSLVRYA